MSTFQGLFLRHFQGDQPGASAGANGLSDSPDVWLNGTSFLQDPSTITTATSYASEPPNTVIVGSGATNYIYVRALNTVSGPVASRVWLWYAEPSMLVWPQKWISQGFYVNGQSQNWCNVNATSPNQIVISDAFELVSPNKPQDHYCMVAMSENPTDGWPISKPPQAPIPGGFADLNAFAAWIAQTPYAAWRNTSDVPGLASTWNYMAPFPGPANGGAITIGVQCTNMPVNSQYQFQIPSGHTSDGTQYPGLDSGVRTVNNPNENYSLQVTWPGNVNTGMNITWWQNGTTYQTGATITPVAGVQAPQLEGLVDDPMKGAKQIILYEDPTDRFGAVRYMHICGGMPLRLIPTTEMPAT